MFIYIFLLCQSPLLRNPRTSFCLFRVSVRLKLVPSTWLYDVALEISYRDDEQPTDVKLDVIVRSDAAAVFV